MPGISGTKATRMGRLGGGPISGASAQRVSRGSPLAITSSARRASRTVRVCGPWVDINWPPMARPAVAMGEKAGMRPWPTRRPTTPLQ